MLSNSAFADQALKVKTGDTVPYDGTLLDKEKADKIRDQLIERDEFEKLNFSYQKSIDLYKANETIYNQENSLLLGRNIELSKALNDAKSTSDITKILYFTLGIGIAGLGVYGASHLIK